MARRKRKGGLINKLVFFLMIVLLGLNVYLFLGLREAEVTNKKLREQLSQAVAERLKAQIEENKKLKEQIAELQIQLTILKERQK